MCHTLMPSLRTLANTLTAPCPRRAPSAMITFQKFLETPADDGPGGAVNVMLSASVDEQQGRAAEIISMGRRRWGTCIVAAAMIAGPCGEARHTAFRCDELRPAFALNVGSLGSRASMQRGVPVQRAATRRPQPTGYRSKVDAGQEDQWVQAKVEVVGVADVSDQDADTSSGSELDTPTKSARQKRVDAFFDGVDNELRLKRAREQEAVVKKMARMRALEEDKHGGGNAGKGSSAQGRAAVDE